MHYELHRGPWSDSSSTLRATMHIFLPDPMSAQLQRSGYQDTGQKRWPPSKCGCAVCRPALLQLNTKLRITAHSVSPAAPPGVRGSPPFPVTCTHLWATMPYADLPLSFFFPVSLRSPLAGPSSILCNNPRCQRNFCLTCVPLVNPNRRTAQDSAPGSTSPFPSTRPARHHICFFVALETKAHQYQLFTSSGHKERLSCHRAVRFLKTANRMWLLLAKNWSWLIGYN